MSRKGTFSYSIEGVIVVRLQGIFVSIDYLMIRKQCVIAAILGILFCANKGSIGRNELYSRALLWSTNHFSTIFDLYLVMNLLGCHEVINENGGTVPN